MHLCSGHLVTSSEEQSNSKSKSSSKSHSSPQSRLNMDPPPQDELRQAIAELTAHLGHLEGRYEEVMHIMEEIIIGMALTLGKTIETMKTTQQNISKYRPLPSMVLGTLRSTMIGCKRWSIFLSGMNCLRTEMLGLPK